MMIYDIVKVLEFAKENNLKVVDNWREKEQFLNELGYEDFK